MTSLLQYRKNFVICWSDAQEHEAYHYFEWQEVAVIPNILFYFGIISINNGLVPNRCSAIS